MNIPYSEIFNENECFHVETEEKIKMLWRPYRNEKPYRDSIYLINGEKQWLWGSYFMLLRTQLDLSVQDDNGIIKYDEKGKVINKPVYIEKLTESVADFECAVLLMFDWQKYKTDGSETPVEQGIGAVHTSDGFYPEILYMLKNPTGKLYETYWDQAGCDVIDLSKFPFNECEYKALAVNSSLFDPHMFSSGSITFCVNVINKLKVNPFEYRFNFDRLRDKEKILLRQYKKLLGSEPENWLIPYDLEERKKKFSKAYKELEGYIAHIKKNPWIFEYEFYVS